MAHRPALKPRGEIFRTKVKSTIIASPTTILVMAPALVARFQYNPPMIAGTREPTPPLASVRKSLIIAGFVSANTIEITPKISTHALATRYCLTSSASLLIYFLYTSVEISVLTAWSWESPVDMDAANAPAMIKEANTTGVYFSSNSGKMVSATAKSGISTRPAILTAGVKM